ncbi:hypothetical protein Tco_0983357 [Tanacetum coccineum]
MLWQVRLVALEILTERYDDRLGCRYEVPMIGLRSEPIIGLAEGMFQKVTCQAVSGGSGIYQAGNDWVLGRGSRGNNSQSLAFNMAVRWQKDEITPTVGWALYTSFPPSF